MTDRAARRHMRDIYGVDFPDDFFRFRKFLAALPDEALRTALDMSPAHIFRAADGHPPPDHPDRPLWQDRYYDDLPEFVTLLNGHCDGMHWGYVFDAPGDRPPRVAHYWASDTFEHGTDGTGLFTAVRGHLENSQVEFEEMAENEEEDEEYLEDAFAAVRTVRKVMTRFWGADRPEEGEEYIDAHSETDRSEYTVETWDRLGVWVPDGLYRPLSGTPIHHAGGKIVPKQIPKFAAEAMRLLTDGYPGAALALGRELWVFAEHRAESVRLLDAAYAALGRDVLRRWLTEANEYRTHCDKPPKKRKRADG